MLDDKIIVFFGFLSAFIITLISIPSIIKVAHMKRLFDEPGERTVHTHAVPTLGGLAVFAGLSVTSLLLCEAKNMPEINFIIASVIIIFFVGIKDDILVIAPLTKLIGQIAATLLFVFFSGLKLDNLHGFFGIHEISYWQGVFLTVFTVIVIVNGFNLIDGIDGLSASITIITSLSFGTWFYLAGYMDYAILSAALTGSLAAFLRYNLFSRKRKIFLGDTGSLINGWIVSVLVIKFNESNISHSNPFSIWGSPAVSFGILIIPLFDTVRVMFIRAIKRRSVFKPDKQHIHHLLLELGLSHKRSVLMLVIINILFVFFSFALHNVFGIRTLLLLIIILAMLVFFIPVLIKEKRKRTQKQKRTS